MEGVVEDVEEVLPPNPLPPLLPGGDILVEEECVGERVAPPKGLLVAHEV